MRFQGARLCAFACVVLGGLAQPALAADGKSGAKLGFLVEGDIEYGGDDVVTVSFKDGSTQDIKAGQGATVAVGGYFKPEESSPFSLRATVGYKFVTTAASNADIGIDRIVYELVGDYDWPTGWHVGAGLARHTNIKFDADGFGRNMSFDDATGVTAELGWKWISLSYTAIDYKDELGRKWNAGSVGLAVAWRF
jgi:hypothetical protein